MLIGKRIQKFRKSRGETTKIFSSTIGISQGSLSDIENGKTHPSCDTLINIAQKTDICACWLLSGRHHGICLRNRSHHSKCEIIKIMSRIIDLYQYGGKEQRQTIEEQLQSLIRSLSQNK